jgi:hypothetical protein
MQSAPFFAERGQPLSYAALDNRFEDARNRAAAAVDDAGMGELATAIRTFQFRDLRAKAGTDKADATDIRSAQQQLWPQEPKDDRDLRPKPCRREGHADQIIHRIAEQRRNCGAKENLKNRRNRHVDWLPDQGSNLGPAD